MVRLLPTLLLVAQLILSASSHSIPNMLPRSGQHMYPYLVLGTDSPPDWGTTGYFINYFAISTRNLTASLDFYSRVLGFRKMLTLHVFKTYSITYLAHAHGGLLEIYYLDIPNKNIESSSQHPNTFAHIGLVVPDAQAIQERLETMPDVKIVKRYGEKFTDITDDLVIGPAVGLPSSVVAQLRLEQREAVVQGLGHSVDPLLFIVDPDGNFIEIQGEEGADLVQG
ncbi:lactoylglutathione lyase [Fusarium subglutinans]|uniref:Lactoylglutathione lyase n=1 Tax=Gibberella subglutinans TaxID=42677 RepID=A0A8H5V3S2_GIBSU|nr:lactoylglutathione lyase [Fusarium subglutinans]KAF5609902.1 lactoylglutathione lyase [Fusarium subglutinans]